jgi:2-amino-4-hydroxy-6-hydroxymethyldihydropteridine diphosphokinase
VTVAYVAFGGNLGNVEETFRQVLNRLERHEAITQVHPSELFRTSPTGGPSGQPDYLNAVIELETTCSCAEFFRFLVDLEADLGRHRGVRWAPRSADLDLLLFGDECTVLPELTVPHPRMHFRRFVLAPMATLNRGVRHPVLHQSVGELLTLVEAPNAVLAVVGGERQFFEFAAARFQTVRPQGSAVSVSARSAGARSIALGSNVVGTIWSRTTAPADAIAHNRSWAVLVENVPPAPQTNQFAQAVLVPTVDCRAASAHEAAAAFEHFIAAISL